MDEIIFERVSREKLERMYDRWFELSEMCQENPEQVDDLYIEYEDDNGEETLYYHPEDGCTFMFIEDNESGEISLNMFILVDVPSDEGELVAYDVAVDDLGFRLGRS